MASRIRFLWNELRPRGRKWKRGASECGPCYDLCSCRACWRGWSAIGFFTKLRWRVHYLTHFGYEQRA